MLQGQFQNGDGILSEIKEKLLSETDELNKVSKELEQYKSKHEQSEYDHKESLTHLKQLESALDGKNDEIKELKKETEGLKAHLLEGKDNNTEMIIK